MPPFLAPALAVALTLLPRLAFANAGVPTLGVAWPISWLALVPICALEGFMARRMLRLTPSKAAEVAVLANLASTFVGIPVAWALTGGAGSLALSVCASVLPRSLEWLALPFAIMAYSAYLPSHRGAPWMPFVGAAILCLPFYFASVLIEARVASKLLPGSPPEEVRRWAKRANQISYLAIAAVTTAIAADIALTSL